MRERAPVRGCAPVRAAALGRREPEGQSGPLRLTSYPFSLSTFHFLIRRRIEAHPDELTVGLQKTRIVPMAHSQL